VRTRFARKIESDAALFDTLADPRVAGMPRLVLGGGSNVMLTRHFDGLALLVALRGRRVAGETPDAWLVEAGAGENWHEFVAWTLSQGLPGLENLALVPGTVGAAPIQNIGAYGIELAERFEKLSALDLATRRVVELSASDCAFGYRDSFFKRAGRDRFVIRSVTFRLPKAWQPRASYADVRSALHASGIETPTPQQIFDAVVAIRRAKLPDPLALGNAGSFFKNPLIGAAQFAALRDREPQVVSYAQPNGGVKLAAGWLIDRCGWKGRTLGGAGVHERQALVLVNRGNATGAEVLALADAIRADVRARFGVELEMEPVVV
jgi:UDP-N-acetylmuramate dehydrogenase